MAHVLSQQLINMLYIMSGCLLYIISMPGQIASYGHRKRAFVVIFISLALVYTALGAYDSFQFAVHLAPIAVVFAMLFGGYVPLLTAWLIMNAVNTLLAGNSFLPVFAGTTAICIVGLVFYYKLLLEESQRDSLLQAAIMLLCYMAAFSLFGGFAGVEAQVVGLSVLGTALSGIIVSVIYYRMLTQERLLERTVNQEKLRLIAQLAASISHEVRNPLTTAHGFLQLLTKEGLSAQQFNRYREQAIEGIKEANSIIEDYLNVADPRVSELEKLIVPNEIDSTMLWIRKLAAESNVAIQVCHHEPELVIQGESAKLQQSLFNVIKNAVEAMPAGGRLTVESSLVEGHAEITIRDTGTGMTMPQMNRIGVPHFTTKEKGTGLGLMVAISLVKAMSGTIVFKSKPGAGTTCIMRFPSMGGDRADRRMTDQTEEAG